MPKFLEDKPAFPQTLPNIIICHTNAASWSVANHVPTHRIIVLLSVKSVLQNVGRSDSDVCGDILGTVGTVLAIYFLESHTNI